MKLSILVLAVLTLTACGVEKATNPINRYEYAAWYLFTGRYCTTIGTQSTCVKLNTVPAACAGHTLYNLFGINPAGTQFNIQYGGSHTFTPTGNSIAVAGGETIMIRHYLYRYDIIEYAAGCELEYQTSWYGGF